VEIGSISHSGGLWGGMIINCTTDEEVLTKLQAIIDLGHYAEVKLLKDDEEFPSIESRRRELIDAYLKEGTG
jgi:hypothetical protein